MKKILFIKLGALGDLSYALPAAKALKSSLDCHVTWLVGKSCKDFLVNHAYIDELIIIDDKKIFSKNIFVRMGEVLKLFFNLRKRFDQVIIAHRDPIYFHVFRWFSRENTWQITRDPHKNPKQFVYVKPMTTHESLAIKILITTAIGKNNVDWQWDYSYVLPAKIALPKNFIAIHLGGGVNMKTEFQLKRWPHWQELILKLLQQTQYPLVFLGAPSEKTEYDPIAAMLTTMPEYQSCCNNLIGKTSLQELIDVIRQSQLFLGVDSGPLHIADSLGKKCIGLYGPTSPTSWGLLSPQGKTLNHPVHCSPCYKDDGIFPPCPHQHQCMQLLSSDDVLNSVE